MASSPEVAGAEIEKVKIEIRAELWIDPLDFLPLAERKTMLLTGRRPKWRTSFPMCGVDMAVKESAPRFFLEIFTTELTRALNPSSRHGFQEQKSTDPSSCYNLLDEKSITEQMYPDNNHISVKRRSDDIQNNIATVDLEPALTSFHIAIKVEDSYQFKNCGSQDSERNDCQEQSSCCTLSAPILKIRDEFDDTNCVCEEIAEQMSISPSDHQELLTPKNVSNLLPTACNDNFFSEASNLLEKEVHSSNVSQKETHSNVSCLLPGSPLSASVARVKVEVTDGNTDVQLSEVDVSEMPQLLHHGPQGSVQTFTCSDNLLPCAVQNSQESCKNRDRYSQETSGSAKGQLRVSTLPDSSARANVGALVENRSHQVVPDGSDITDMLSDSVLQIDSTTVKRERCGGNLVGRSSDSLDKTVCANTFSSKFSSCCDFQVKKERNTIGSYISSRGVPIGEKHQTRSHMAGLLTDSVLSTCHAMVKDEPSEGDDVPGTHETNSKKSSRCSIFGSPNNTTELTSLQAVEHFSDAGNCQNISTCRVSGLQCNQETAISSSELNLPADAPLVTGVNNTCMTTQPLVSDVSAFKVSKNAEKLQENLAARTSDCTSESLSALYPSNILGVKSEPMESTTYNLFDPHLGSLSSDVRVVEAKSEVINAPSVDILDLMPLSERMMMLTSTVASVLEPARKSRCFKETRVHAVTGRDSVDSLKLKSETSTRRRKRKKTATDSAEIALEEDAPGLLQGLLDKGINLDEIKLYGCEEDNDVLDCASDENSFEDLEGVISKIFSKRSNSLLKLNPLRPGKGTKAVYCLACLISLIEQARYLQFRNCPVEWGWCRDLQSFIFVFEMHNRIVLERPEYGYATYFFELVESLPIDWQIKRLVTAMKLTSCSRVTLIENKPLLVGSDISEGEARVLEDYGWRPNCGLGSMLNYCDRVVHDRSHERNTSDWRAKIGKLLMDGYDGGRIVQADLPKKVLDLYTEVKLES